MGEKKSGGDLEDERKAHLIETPVLLLQAGVDHVVYTEGQDYVCVQAPNCTKVFFPQGHHELMFETDEIRNRVFSEMFKFLGINDEVGH